MLPARFSDTDTRGADESNKIIDSKKLKNITLNEIFLLNESRIRIINSSYIMNVKKKKIFMKNW